MDTKDAYYRTEGRGREDARPHPAAPRSARQDKMSENITLNTAASTSCGNEKCGSFSLLFNGCVPPFLGYRVLMGSWLVTTEGVRVSSAGTDSGRHLAETGTEF